MTIDDPRGGAPRRIRTGDPAPDAGRRSAPAHVAAATSSDHGWPNVDDDELVVVSATATPSPRKRRHPWRWAAGILTIIVLLAGAGAVYLNTRPSQPDHKIIMFAGGVPGTPAALAPVVYAEKVGIDDIMSYSALNAPTAQTVALLEAYSQLHVKIILDVSTLLPPPGSTVADLDKNAQDVAFHHQYGADTNTEVANVIKTFDHYSAVDGYMYAEEAVDDLSGLATWGPALRYRYTQMRGLTSKLLLNVMAWGNNRPPFLKAVQALTPGSDLAVDYYAYPETPASITAYGPIAQTKAVGATVRADAGQNSMVITQIASWQNMNPQTGAKLGFGTTNPAPSAKDIAYMAGLGLEGGAQNVGLFSYESMMASGEADNVKQAIGLIRALPGFA